VLNKRRVRALKKTKIICTLGPSTDNLSLVEEMIKEGMDLARFNFSHGTHEGHAARIEIVREAAGKTGKPVALIADTKGLKCGSVFLAKIR
jgi:pyruvate kinase